MISSVRFKGKWLIASLSYVLFLLYISIASNLLFFSSYRQGVRAVRYGMPEYNLVPLHTITNYIKASGYINSNIVIMNIVGNVIAFMPLGFFLPLLFSRYLKLWKALVFVFGTTLTVECMQFLFHVGSFDVDDLILNTIGGGLGFIVFKIVYMLARPFIREGER